MCIHSLDFTIEMQPIIPFHEWGERWTPGAENGSVLSQSRDQWQSFLGHHRGVALNMNGGSIPWERFAPVGSDVYPQHFTRRLALSTIRDEIGAELYERAIRMTWFDYQLKTRALNEKLQAWFDSLPDELRVDYAGQAKFDPRSRLELAMYHQSVCMILWRPCLCEIVIKDESTASTNFNREGALACVQSALHMLDMMPDPPVRAEIYEILPWWPVLHYICQATAVLLLELAMDMQHMQEEATRVTAALRKAIDYLCSLAPHSKSAYKAWNIIRCLVYKLPERYRTGGLSDIPTLAPKPPNWDEGNETMMEVGLRTLR